MMEECLEYTYVAPLTGPMTLTADGCAEVLRLDDPSCCPPPLCGNDLCCTFVAFFNLLPSGPMWDYWKQQAVGYFESHDDPAECPLIKDPSCPTLVLHSIYSVLKLKYMVYNALWPALRESDPYTAITTIDNWLDRYKWEDCFRSHCRDPNLGALTPYEIMTACGPEFCEAEISDELNCAVKRGIAIALTRASMGVIKNLCGINWIIEPLGAEIKPIPITPDENGVWCVNDCGVVPPQFELCNTRDWIEGCGEGDVCDTRSARPHIPAYWGDCNKPAGLPETIWPGVLAAECIVRSLLPQTCPSNILVRCC